MGRSVSYASGSIVKAYLDVSWIEESFQWSDFIWDLRHQAKAQWPSLEDCSQWLGREDHAILENALCYIGLSEYCGLACLWIVPKEIHNQYGDNIGDALSVAWCERIAPKFHSMFGQLRRIGGFSNGTSIYERVNVEAAA